MSVFALAGEKLNNAFWKILRAAGLVLSLSGALLLLGGFVAMCQQILDFFRDDRWRPEPLLTTLPDNLVSALIRVGDLGGVSVQLVDFLYWIPLSVSAFFAGVALLLIGKVLRREYDTF